MNIFATDDCPLLSAQALDDKRVRKMLMESNQMLSLAVKCHLPLEAWQEHIGEGQVTYGYAHLNHPVSIWVRETSENFLWTIAHAEELAAECQYRFGLHHGSAPRTAYIKQHFRNCVPEGPLLDFQNSARNASLGVDFSWIEPATEAYRQYLRYRWPRDTLVPKWTRRGPPEWYDADT